MGGVLCSFKPFYVALSNLTPIAPDCRAEVLHACRSNLHQIGAKAGDTAVSAAVLHLADGKDRAETRLARKTHGQIRMAGDGAATGLQIL